MKVSVCITTFNEKEETVKKLLDALKKQTFKPDEIIIVDAKDYDNCSIAKGRNISVKKAKNEIIATTDVGCIPEKDWLEKITKPFHKNRNILVAGFYTMPFKTPFQEASRVYLGVPEDKFDEKTFLPSARSMAFSKSVWKKLGGFNEKLDKTGEDTYFCYKALMNKINIVRVKGALVNWKEFESMTFKKLLTKFFVYAVGDGQAGIWWYPAKGLQSHNIKILTVYLRYAIGLWLLVVSKTIFLLYALLYMVYAYKKARFWGILLQILSDFAVMGGFLKGLLMR